MWKRVVSYDKDTFAPSPTGYLHIGGLRTALTLIFTPKRRAGDLFCG
ncbi:MAG: glutamate--tRNA ligase family protein [Christensenellales bacterium]